MQPIQETHPHRKFCRILQTRTQDIWVTSPTLFPLGHNPPPPPPPPHPPPHPPYPYIKKYVISYIKCPLFDVVSETSLFTFKFLWVWSVMWVNNWWTHLPRGPWELFSISEINIVRSMGLCWSAFPSHNLCHTYTGTQKNRKKGHKDLTSRFAAGKKTFIQKRALLRIDYKMTNFTDEDLDNYLQNQVTYLCCHVCRDLTRLMVFIL